MSRMHISCRHDVDAFYALEYGTSNAAQTPCSNVLKSREPPKSWSGQARLSCLPHCGIHRSSSMRNFSTYSDMNSTPSILWMRTFCRTWQTELRHKSEKRADQKWHNNQGWCRCLNSMAIAIAALMRFNRGKSLKLRQKWWKYDRRANKVRLSRHPKSPWVRRKITQLNMTPPPHYQQWQ